MINLLPTDSKKQIVAARINVILIRYNLIVLASVIFLSGALGFAYYYLTTAQQIAETSISDNVKKEGDYAEIKAKADNFRQELASAKTILDSQTSYAKAALNIAKLLPSGTSLSELKLDDKSFSTPLILKVNIVDEQAAIELLDNFSHSPFFSNVTKGKISVGTGSYPYVMELSMNMSKAAAQ